MRDVSAIVTSFYNAAAAVSAIAKVEFITEFTKEDLQRVARSPVLLISPHRMSLAYSRHRQRGTQLLVSTFLVSRQQRLERDSTAALAFTEVLDTLDAAIVNNDLNLDIQPFDIYQRNAVEVEKGISVVKTIYSTLIYKDLATSRFSYVNGLGATVNIDFNLVSTSFQTEEIQDTNDYDWTLDGTYKSYSRTPKKKYDLKFTLIPSTLKDSLLTLKQADTSLTFYRDKTKTATMTCLWSNAFNFFEERNGRWTGSIKLHEA